jgi:hypothetical protein
MLQQVAVLVAQELVAAQEQVVLQEKHQEQAILQRQRAQAVAELVVFLRVAQVRQALFMSELRRVNYESTIFCTTRQ